MSNNRNIANNSPQFKARMYELKRGESFSDSSSQNTRCSR
jgi:hypothetical protein